MVEQVGRVRKGMADDVRHLDDQALSDYLDGRLNPRQTAAVEAHLDACADCAAAFAGLRRTVAALRSLPVLAPPRSFTLGLAALPARPARRSLVARLEVWTRGLAAVAAALLVVLLGVDLLAPSAPAPRPEAITPAGRFETPEAAPPAPVAVATPAARSAAAPPKPAAAPAPQLAAAPTPGPGQPGVTGVAPGTPPAGEAPAQALQAPAAAPAGSPPDERAGPPAPAPPAADQARAARADRGVPGPGEQEAAGNGERERLPSEPELLGAPLRVWELALGALTASLLGATLILRALRTRGATTRR